MSRDMQPTSPLTHRGYIPVERGRLFFREIGQGLPIIILHGGPDFDHLYLLPEMDRLARHFRLIYYDQRGRGKSAIDVEPEDVSLASEISDIESVRKHFHLDRVAVLGHSWGGVLAMEHATRFPEHVSHMILMNTAPASYADVRLLRKELSQRRSSEDRWNMARLASTPLFAEGDPDTVADYYRIHFRVALNRPQDVERVIQRLRAGFTSVGVLKASAIEDRLMIETHLSSAYDLTPKLERLDVPTLLIHGDRDIIPIECAVHIADAIPGAQLNLLEQCGHFPYLEQPEETEKIIVDWL